MIIDTTESYLERRIEQLAVLERAVDRKRLKKNKKNIAQKFEALEKYNNKMTTFTHISASDARCRTPASWLVGATRDNTLARIHDKMEKFAQYLKAARAICHNQTVVKL